MRFKIKAATYDIRCWLAGYLTPKTERPQAKRPPTDAEVMSSVRAADVFERRRRMGMTAADLRAENAQERPD